MKNKKGISLIVLVITIIVMIILAAAVVVSLNNTGIIGKANVAVKETNAKQIEDLAALAWADAYMEGARTESELQTAVNEALKDVDTTGYTVIVTGAGVSVVQGDGKAWTQDGTKVTNGILTLAVGDYVDYVSGVTDYEDENGWRVVGAENGELLLVSTTHVGELTLGGSDIEDAKNDYLTGISQLNTVCAPFGNGAKASSVRSIKAEDINRVAKYDPTTFVNSQLPEESNNIIISEYGEILTYYWNGEYRPIYKSGTETGVLIGGFIDSNENINTFLWYDQTDKVWRSATNNKGTGAITDDTDGTKIATLKSDTYIKYYTEFIEGTPEYTTFIKNGETGLDYWLATQSTGQIKGTTNMAGYGLYAQVEGIVLGAGIVLVNNKSLTASGVKMPVRAVVALDRDVTLSKVTDTSWTITNK